MKETGHRIRKPATPGRGPPPRDVDEYLARVPEPARTTLTKVRAAIRSAVPPEATETISYRMPAFKYKRIVVWFAAFSDHCSLFPTRAIIDAFQDDLRRFTLAKGTIQFPLNKPLPTALIRKMIKARITQIDKKR